MNQNIFNKGARFYYLHGNDEENIRRSFYPCMFLEFVLSDDINTAYNVSETMFEMLAPIPYRDYQKITSEDLEEIEIENYLTPEKRLKKLNARCSSSEKIFVNTLKKIFMKDQKTKELIFDGIEEFLENMSEDTKDADNYVIKNIFKRIMLNEEDKLRLTLLLKEI